MLNKMELEADRGFDDVARLSDHDGVMLKYAVSAVVAR